VEHWLASNRKAVSWLAVALVAAGAFAFIFFVLPPLVVENGTTADENGVRSAGSQFLAALVLAAGLYFTGRTLQINREGQITDRFSKAIEQLGSDKLDVRLGGIYALERIARDSRRDHGPVVEVLSAYVRRYQRSDSEPQERAPYDVQAAVSVLGRRTTAHDEGRIIDLSGADLRFLRIDGANLRDAFMQDVDLTEAQVAETDLTRAVFQNARVGAIFGQTDLSESHLWGADFTGAMFLFNTRFEGAEYDDSTVWPPSVDPAALGATDAMARNLQQPDDDD
jgi:pentapeptide repeat protein